MCLVKLFKCSTYFSILFFVILIFIQSSQQRFLKFSENVPAYKVQTKPTPDRSSKAQVACTALQVANSSLNYSVNSVYLVRNTRKCEILIAQVKQYPKPLGKAAQHNTEMVLCRVLHNFFVDFCQFFLRYFVIIGTFMLFVYFL